MTSTYKIKIGTRGSMLALWQAYHIQSLLTQGGLETEIITIETKGDKILNQPLSEIGSKGLFTEELEEKLQNGTIDIAVHSAKDMPSELGKDLEIIAYTEREKPNDVLVSLDKNFSLKNDPSLLIGTSSTRRKAVIKRNFPNVQLAEARGNLQTRFRKMEEGEYQAMILAYAGVHRMGYDDKIVQLFSTEEFTPAVGQGSIAIEASTALDQNKRSLIQKLVNHAATETCLLAERSFLKTLQGGCSVPVYALATIQSELLIINGGVISLDGQTQVADSITGTIERASEIGEELAYRLLKKGAGNILETIKPGYITKDIPNKFQL